jgi:hypothetical protein
MLTGRKTRLRFDNHTMNPITINNGIGQGDPLSMGLYQYYNANLLDIPAEPNQLAIAYVDDTILFASGSTFKEMHENIADMMTKEKGTIKWSKDHNSPFESSKLTLIDFAHPSRHTARSSLRLPHGTVAP